MLVFEFWCVQTVITVFPRELTLGDESPFACTVFFGWTCEDGNHPILTKPPSNNKKMFCCFLKCQYSTSLKNTMTCFTDIHYT